MVTKFKITILFFISTFLIHAQSARQIYIDTYDVAAMREMKEFKIPASITLAQGILESGDGKSKLAVKAKNHFGIKCHDDWKGGRVYHDDDKKNECFRKYKNADQSFRDHSLFLSGRSRYASLFELEPDDYKGWAKGLQDAGYATSKTYSKTLIKIIEENDLQRFDKQVLNGEEDYLEGLILVSANRLKYIRLEKNQDLEDVARQYDVKISRLLSYNDLRHDDKVEENAIIYLQKKRKKGSIKYYRVKEGDSMYSISQDYGIRLGELYKKNKMRIGSQPKAGDELWLKRTKK